MDREQLINVKQMAELFQCCTKTIYRWRAERRIPQPIKKWGSPMWSYREVIEYMRQGKTVKKVA